VTVPCYLQSLGNAFAYSAWLGLDERKFPIAAVHRAAELWMTIALCVQGLGIALTGVSFKGRFPALFVYLVLVPASFLPILITVAVLSHR
jgi:hypothetical protein